MPLYLITGASGFLGYHLVRQLVEDGADVKILDLNPPGSSRTLARSIAAPLLTADPPPLSRAADDPKAFRPAEHFHVEADAAARISFVQGNILETDKLEAECEGVDGVFHLAGIVKHSRDNPHPPTVEVAWKVNVEGTFNVFNAVAKVGERQGKKARIVYASSSGCVACQNSRTGPGGDESPLCEDVVRGDQYGEYGKFPYYAAKIEVEQKGMPLAEELGLEVVWMRPTMMLGPGDHLFRSTGLVVSFLKGSIPMVPSGGASFLDVRDSAAMFKAAMELEELPRPNPTYTLGAHNCTVRELFALFAKHTGVRAPTWSPPYFLLHAAASFLYRASKRTNTTLDPVRAEMGSVFWDCDWSMAEKELGFKPRDHEETVVDTIEYVRKHHSHPKVNGSKPCSGPPAQWAPKVVNTLVVALIAWGVWKYFGRNRGPSTLSSGDASRV